MDYLTYTNNFGAVVSYVFTGGVSSKASIFDTTDYKETPINLARIPILWPTLPLPDPIPDDFIHPSQVLDKAAIFQRINVITGKSDTSIIYSVYDKNVKEVLAVKMIS
jgi:hypothetical protein